MTKTENEFIREIEEKIREAVANDPKPQQGLTMNEDDQDWGSSGLTRYTSNQQRA
jgi:hypothetical protein